MILCEIYGENRNEQSALAHRKFSALVFRSLLAGSLMKFEKQLIDSSNNPFNVLYILMLQKRIN